MSFKMNEIMSAAYSWAERPASSEVRAAPPEATFVTSLLLFNEQRVVRMIERSNGKEVVPAVEVLGGQTRRNGPFDS